MRPENRGESPLRLLRLGGAGLDVAPEVLLHSDSRSETKTQTKASIPSMAKYKLEYIWLDGYQPTPNLRSKTKIEEFSSFPKLEQLPFWGFDGSSTRQAEGRSSDCMLKPVAVYPDSTRKNGAS